MTGFGRAYVARDGRELTVEIKTVNHRFLDTSFRLPHAIAPLEDAIRSRITSRLARGRVELSAHYRNMRADAHTIQADVGLAEQYLGVLRQLAEQLHLPANLDVRDIARQGDVLVSRPAEEDEQALAALVDEAVNLALDDVIAMRSAEGKRLYDDMCQKVDTIARIVDRISLRAPLVAEEHGQRLRNRLNDMLGDEVPPERLAVEIAVLADRSCIDEELVRLRSHITAFGGLDGDQPQGRRMDFLIQEFNREANTIGSKANDSAVAAEVIALKTEIEKLREQAQNIE